MAGSLSRKNVALSVSPIRQVPTSTARQAPAPRPGGLLQVLLQLDPAAGWTSMSGTAALTSTLTKLDIANSAQFSERIVSVCGVFYEFCCLANRTPRPSSERDLCRFVSHLVSIGWKHRTLPISD